MIEQLNVVGSLLSGRISIILSFFQRLLKFDIMNILVCKVYETS